MKGLVYRGPRDVRVEDVPDAKLDWPTDVLVRITSTNICGSDLHMYEGRTDLEPGMVIGHENLGQVIEVGSAVHLTAKPESRIVIRLHDTGLGLPERSQYFLGIVANAGNDTDTGDDDTAHAQLLFKLLWA